LATGIPARLSKAEGRRFGFTVGAAFVALAAITVLRHKPIAVTATLGGAGVLLVLAALAIPGSLGPVQRAWMRFAELLSKVTTPVVMAVLYFGVFVPFGVLKRLFGRSGLQKVAAGESGWTARATGRSDLRRQF
jgi:hypothetical protein